MLACSVAAGSTQAAGRLTCGAAAHTATQLVTHAPYCSHQHCACLHCAAFPSFPSNLLPHTHAHAEVLCLYEDEVVLLQDRLLQQQGLDKGLPGIAYELADMQV